MLLPLFGDASEPTYDVFLSLFRDAPEPTGEEGEEDQDFDTPKIYENVSCAVSEVLLVLRICVWHLVIISCHGSRMHFFISFLNQLRLAFVLVFRGKNWLLLIHVFKAFSKHILSPKNGFSPSLRKIQFKNLKLRILFHNIVLVLFRICGRQVLADGVMVTHQLFDLVPWVTPLSIQLLCPVLRMCVQHGWAIHLPFLFTARSMTCHLRNFTGFLEYFTPFQDRILDFNMFVVWSLLPPQANLFWEGQFL